MPGLKERAKTLVELIESARYLYAERPIPLDEKAAALLDEGGRTLLAGLTDELAAVNPGARMRPKQPFARSPSAPASTRCGREPFARLSPAGPRHPASSKCWRYWVRTKPWRASPIRRTVVLSVSRGNRFKRPNHRCARRHLAVHPWMVLRT